MTRLQKLFAGIAAVFMMAGVPTAALAQKAPVILFIDEGKLLATSKAGQSINNQLQELAVKAEAQLKSEGEKVESEGKKLQDSKDSLSKEDFAKRYQVLLQQAQAVGRLEQIKKAELNQARAVAMVDLNKALEPVVKDILAKKNATVLLERTAVVFADDEMDITEDIVKALDKKVKTVKVKPVDLIAQAEAARAAQNK